MALLGLAAIVVFLLDRATKLFVLGPLDLANRLEVEVLPPFLTFRMAWNTGINFGLFGSEGDVMRWALVALAVVVSIGLAIWGGRAKGWRVPVSAGVVIGGALGNAWDRVQYGAVADFLNMSCCGIRNPYAFNVADVAIFAGALALVLFTGGGENET